MVWKDLLKKGISSFQAGDLESSLTYFNQAIQLDGSRYVIYDSRAAVYDKLERPNEALRDAKKVIDIAPDQWQGYARSARIFLKVHKYDVALLMIDRALGRVKADDARRHAELTNLKGQALCMRASAMERERRLASETTYHFGTLPLEMCVEIFREVTLSDPGQVVILSLVSRHWRTIVLNTPALWSTLVVSAKNPVRKVKKWVERSKGIIRELRIREGVLNDGKWTMDKLDCMHWDALRICRVEASSFFTYLESNSLTHILSNLTELEVTRVSPGVFNQYGSCVLNRLSDANLRYLELDGVRFNLDALASRFTRLVSLVVRWSGLTWFSFTLVLAVMEANPTLEKLVLDLAALPRFVTHSSFSLPLLTQLEIGSGTGMAKEIFNYVTLPSLQRLRFFRGITVDFWFGKVQQPCWSFLRELRIQSCYLMPYCFIEFLKKAPALNTLEISYLSDGANRVVEALATPVPSLHGVPLLPTFLCPRLAHVNFSHCPDIQTGPLLRLVKSRLPPLTSMEAANEADAQCMLLLAQIESIVVDGCPLVEASALPWLRAKVRMVSCVYMSKKEANWKR